MDYVYKKKPSNSHHPTYESKIESLVHICKE